MQTGSFLAGRMTGHRDTRSVQDSASRSSVTVTYGNANASNSHAEPSGCEARYGVDVGDK